MAQTSKGKGWRVTWLGDEVGQQAEEALSDAWTQVGLAVEGEAKKELYKGHGVVTGTLRRSIHLAPPEYRWESDNVEPAADSPERGGKEVAPTRKNGKLTLWVGSGMAYAAAIEFGFGTFEGYRYLRNGLDKVRPKIPAILKAWFSKKFGKSK